MSKVSKELATPTDLAPAWHTAVLIGLQLSVAGAGFFLASRGVKPAVPVPGAAGPAITPIAKITAVYLPIVVVAWGLLFYVCRIGRRRNALPSLLGERWTTARRAATDVGIAAVGWILLKGFELGWAHTFSSGAGAGVSAMLPQTWLERAAWVVLAASVGFSEEVVFRGYLQTQLRAFTGRTIVAILLQAVLFGIAHGEQGIGAMARIAVYGLGFGVLAWWRRSLLPGIILHVWTDLFSGLVHL